MMRRSSLSSPYVRYSVMAMVNGAPYDPRVDPVEFAFVPLGKDPVSGDWLPGSWETVAGPPLTYVARIQIGPLGTVVLAKGSYMTWIRITDSPEVVVNPVGQLDVF